MKTIVLDHIARIEGNGGVVATIDGRIVTDVKFLVNEGPRLVERLVVGKTPEEDVNLVPRICAICSVSHKYAAIRAMEKALDVKVGPKVKLLRELMHLGEMVESHSLHVFYLALPDYTGFPNAIAMASKFGFEVKIALEMKEFGNRIMKTLAGRYIHGENPVIGGFGKLPDRKELAWIKSRAAQFIPFVHTTVKLFCELNYPDIPEAETLYACCNPPENLYGFVGDEVILSNGDRLDVEDYKKLTGEFLVSHSFCKRSRYQGQPYSVGALARVNCLGERLEGEARTMYKKYFNPRWTRNPLFNNAAQALELLYAFERIPEVIGQLIDLPDEPLVASAKQRGQGTAAVEAPRGILFHSYEISKGRVSGADIITPTAQNAEDIERYCHIAAQKVLETTGQEDAIRNGMDLVIRSFDPCVSCSVHTVQVRTAPDGEWKTKLEELKNTGRLLLVGLGSEQHSDDAVGLSLARRLKKSGAGDVWLETELEARPEVTAGPDQTILFLDSLDFGAEPGRITLLSLQQAAWNSVLSHKLLPLVGRLFDPAALNNAFLLGIQPETVSEGGRISGAVASAMDAILEQWTPRAVC